MIVIVGGLEFEEHQVDCSDRGCEEENFHCRVVDGNKVGEKVQIARYENQRKQDLGATWRGKQEMSQLWAATTARQAMTKVRRGEFLFYSISS